MGRYFGADLRNGILTYQTIDNTTTYWIHLGGKFFDQFRGGYNKDACFMLTGDIELIDELSLDDCKKIRGP